MMSFLKAGAAALATVACALFGGEAAIAQSPALQLPAGVIPPPLSKPMREYFKNHPAAWSSFVAKLPRSQSGPAPGAKRFLAAGGTWTALGKAPTGLCSPHLLHNGIVIAQGCTTGNWYRLKPTVNGSYVNGTWKQIASMPVIGGLQYAPLYYASEVLADGRFLVMGGEYNRGNEGEAPNLGAIYDPAADTWTAVNPPPVNNEISDAQSVLLANGTFLLGPCCDGPATDWLLNPDLTWTPTGAPTAGGNYQDEQGYELLPDGKILTLDIWTNYPAGGATNTELYDPVAGTWSAGGSLPVSLPDPAACATWEIGPAVVRGNGTLVAFGGHTCDATPDPTAILSTGTGVWTQGPDVPSVCGAGGTSPCDLADAPAALMPNGKILFAASSGYGDSPTHFFEMAMNGNAISQVSDPVRDSASLGAYTYNFVVLPTGQILVTNFNTPEVYTPMGTTIANWAPTIATAPSNVARNHVYLLKGKQLNGRSAGAYYGDDYQSATNFPIVRIVNRATGHVFYANTSAFSTLSIAPNRASSCKFKVPGTAETGPSTLYVVANGIASAPWQITVN